MKYSLFGESHGPAIGIVIEDIPSGIYLDQDFIQSQMDRRAPGRTPLSTERKESDKPKILSGIYNNKTTGTPLCAVFSNDDKHSEDYEDLKYIPRPSHADYTGWIRYRGYNDFRGGGHFSGRLTAPLVFAGSIARLQLMKKKIFVNSYISSIHGIRNPKEQEIENQIAEAERAGDSIGGCIACKITGFPSAIGAPDIGKNIEGEIARAMFAIPAVKGIQFGAGFEFANMLGSEANDGFKVNEENVNVIETITNNSGGINGGISNGMPITFELVFRPTPSISIPQKSVNLKTMQNCEIKIKGRHDPCVAYRAVPVVDAMAGIVILTFLQEAMGYDT